MDEEDEAMGQDEDEVIREDIRVDNSNKPKLVSKAKGKTGRTIIRAEDGQTP